MQKFSLTTLGCKVNQYDGNAVSLLLRRRGWVPAGPSGPVNLVVINTCCVTSTAMAKSRQAIRRAVRQSPNAPVLVIGCYSDYDAQTVQEVLGSLRVPRERAMIAGPHAGLPRALGRFLRHLSPTANPERENSDSRNDECMSTANLTSNTATPNPYSIRTYRNRVVKQNVAPLDRLSEIDRFEGHQRAFVKVQDGCDAFCSYCVVPYVRPHVWSKSISQVEAECRNLVAAGHKEIVLSGVFLGAFGRDTAIRRHWAKSTASKLPQLVTSIGRIEGLWRVRLSSLEPGDLTDDLLRPCLATPTFAPHFHLPLQSGSEQILRRMNRQYTPQQFRETVNRLRKALDRPAITTDIIVGFPGESDGDFADTLKLARHVGFAKIHAFPFSPVEPTAAWYQRKETPPPRVVRERMAALRELESETAHAYAKQFMGETMEGLVERTQAPGETTHQAMTDRYLRVGFRGPPGENGPLTGRVVQLRIGGIVSGQLRGTLQ